MPVQQDKTRTRRIPEGPRAIAAVALALFGLIAAAVTIVAVVESYSNLLAFARDHGLSDWRAAMAPAAVDSFVIMGELLLFAALLREWAAKSPYVIGGAMAIWGFALSVGGNVWHAPAATIADRGVSAIWPVTATAGLAGGLIIAKRLISDRKTAVPAKAAKAAKPAAEPAPEQPPPAPDPAVREPRPSRAARAPGLAAARDATEAQLARELTAAVQPWPSDRALAASDARYGGSRRKAARVRQLAVTMSNGGGNGEHRA